MSDIPATIAQVLAHDAKATAAPWESRTDQDCDGYSYLEGGDRDPVGTSYAHAAAALIAYYRTAAPLLARECERLLKLEADRMSLRLRATGPVDEAEALHYAGGCTEGGFTMGSMGRTLNAFRALLQVADERNTARALDAEAALATVSELAHLQAPIVERVVEAEAEAARLRKLFDDAGQGEHNILALLDHYQEEEHREYRARILAEESFRRALVAGLAECKRLRGLLSAAGDAYCWEDEDGNTWASQLGDHAARGQCSGIPTCCVAYYVAGGRELRHGWDYIPCSECVRAGRCVEVKTCDQTCTCGQWATRVSLDDDADDAAAARIAEAVTQDWTARFDAIRADAAREERGRVVAWLEGEADRGHRTGADFGACAMMGICAAAISRGDHAPKETP